MRDIHDTDKYVNDDNKKTQAVQSRLFPLYLIQSFSLCPFPCLSLSLSALHTQLRPVETTAAAAVGLLLLLSNYCLCVCVSPSLSLSLCVRLCVDVCLSCFL